MQTRNAGSLLHAIDIISLDAVGILRESEIGIERKVILAVGCQCGLEAKIVVGRRCVERCDIPVLTVVARRLHISEAILGLIAIETLIGKVDIKALSISRCHISLALFGQREIVVAIVGEHRMGVGTLRREHITLTGFTICELDNRARIGYNLIEMEISAYGLKVDSAHSTDILVDISLVVGQDSPPLGVAVLHAIVAVGKHLSIGRGSSERQSGN